MSAQSAHWRLREGKGRGIRKKDVSDGNERFGPVGRSGSSECVHLCVQILDGGGDEDAKMNGAVNHVGEKKKSTNKRRTEREKGLK